MLVLKPEELRSTTPDALERCIVAREREIATLEQRHAELLAALGVTVDHQRRTAIKRTSAPIGGQIADARTVLTLLRAKKCQAVSDAALIARGGRPCDPLWPEAANAEFRRRGVRSGGF